MTSQRWKTWVLAAITLTCILAPRSLSFLPFIPGVVGYLWLSWQARRPFPLDLPLTIFFGVTVIFAAISSLWAAHPDIAIDRAINTACIFLGGLFLLSVMRTTTLKPAAGFYALIAGYIGIGLYLFADYLTYMKLSGTILGSPVNYWYFNRTLVTYVLLFIPIALLAVRITESKTHRLILLAVLSVALLLPLWKTTSQTAQVSFLLAIGAYAMIRFIKGQRARKTIYALSGLTLAAVIMTAPLIPAPLQQILQGHTQKSAFATGANTDGRLEIWNFVTERISEKPLLGHGVEATRSMKSEARMVVNDTHTILHPHNAYLQIWVELGFAGAMLAAAFALFVLYRISAADMAVQPLYFSLYTSIAGALAIGYGIWQSWQLGLIFALCAFSLLLTRIQKA